MALPDCGPESEIRRTEAEAQSEEYSEEHYSDTDLGELEMSMGMDEETEALSHQIDEGLISCPDEGLEFRYAELKGYDLCVGTDEQTQNPIWTEVEMEAIGVNFCRDYGTGLPTVGIAICFIGSESVSKIFLPPSDTAAQELCGAAKNILTSGDPKEKGQAPELMAELVQHAASVGIKVVDIKNDPMNPVR